MTQPSVLPKRTGADSRRFHAFRLTLTTQPSVMPGEQGAHAPRSPERPVTLLPGKLIHAKKRTRIAGALGEVGASSEPVSRKSESRCRGDTRGVDPVRREHSVLAAMRPLAIVSTERYRARDADRLGRVGVQPQPGRFVVLNSPACFEGPSFHTGANDGHHRGVPSMQKEIPHPRRSNRKTRLPEMSRGDGRAGATSETGDRPFENRRLRPIAPWHPPSTGSLLRSPNRPSSPRPLHRLFETTRLRRTLATSRRERAQVRGNEVSAQEVVNRPARGWWNRPALCSSQALRSHYIDARTYHPNHRCLHLNPNHVRRRRRTAKKSTPTALRRWYLSRGSWGADQDSWCRRT